jgi:hypothetical protein
MLRASHIVTVLAAASCALGIALPSCKPNPDLLKQTIPAGQTTLTASTDPLSYVLLGVGYQNYTCTDAGTFTSAGATADLYDLSCVAKTPADVARITTTANKLWNSKLPIIQCITPVLGKVAAIGKHFFSPSPSGTGISPVWDRRAETKKANAYVLARKTGNIPAPTGAQDVDWLQLANVEGSLATTIYRTDTRGGPPPTSCTPGSSTRVKYVAAYYLMGNTA